MDSTVEIQPIEHEVRSDDAGEKRQADDDVELEGPVPKKAKKGTVIGDVKKVAEMVLVLAAMGKMRGGRVPTDAEKEMMVEAREKLAHVCQSFAPKDVFPRDAFGAVIEDLGFNKLKEQRFGYRAPKMSIVEKLSLAKRKLERTEEFSPSSAAYSSQRSQAAMGTTIENRGPSHGVRMLPPNKPSQLVNPPGGFQPPSTLVQGTPASSASLPYQLPTSEVRPVISSGAVASNPVRDSSQVALPRVERSNFRTDGRPNGTSNALQVQAASGDHSAVRTPTWSVQHHASIPGVKRGLENKVTAQTAIKVEGGAGMTPQITASRPFITQTTAGNPPSMHPRTQGTGFVKSPPLRSTHAEIGKIVQKFLQPRHSERPAWTPPSRDYMNKALACQMCKSMIDEVDNVLVCDACEKGYHLKCLQTTNQKGVPKGEWHCGRCLSMTNGKPLPPKYGRVMRNMGSSQKSTIASAVQSSPDKKASGQNDKVIQQKIIANGKIPLKNSPPVSMANNGRNLPSEVKMENSYETGGSIIVPRKDITESKHSMGSCSNTVSSNHKCVSMSMGSSVDRSYAEKVVELKPQAPVKCETVSDESYPSQALNHLQADDLAGVANTVKMSSKQFPETQPMDSDARESSARGSVGNSSSDESNKEEQCVEQIDPAETAVAINGNAECGSSSSDHLHNVDWIGNVLQVADDKYYYQSCRIRGYMYNVQDYALIRFENERLIPSKLLAMWEDKKAGTKWVTVNQCYFARELPQSVGRPCLENHNEIYLSNYNSTVMAGLIQGPCEVHPPRKFTEESERRDRLARGSNDASQPLYLCKWIYDESKGLFRDVSC